MRVVAIWSVDRLGNSPHLDNIGVNMSHHSEEQWKPVGSCPICDAELLLMGNKIKYHECYPDDWLEGSLIKQLAPHDLQTMIKDILGVV